MIIVIDANIIISALVKDGKSAELLVNPNLQLHAPEFIMEEVNKYRDEILEKTYRTLESFSLILSDILLLVKIIPKSDFEEYIDEVILFSPDEKDKTYLALALKLNCPIWSNDKKLKEQNRVKIYSTEEIIEKLKS